MSNEQQQYTTPSYNPADNSDVGLSEFQQNKFFLRLEKIAPAEVVSYNRITNRATIQILNMSLYSNGTKLNKKAVPDVPVYMAAAGGFVFSFPLKQGDKGWLVTTDCDISVFKKLLTTFVPATLKRHCYESSFFLPDYIKGLNISADDDGAVLITAEDGLTKISIKNGQITQTAANNIINGNLQINGAVTATDTITSDTDVISAGISGKSHTHTGVEPGAGNTGAPQ